MWYQKENKTIDMSLKIKIVGVWFLFCHHGGCLLCDSFDDRYVNDMNLWSEESNIFLWLSQTCIFEGIDY